ncbi:MAG: HAD family phosphatase [Bacteroidota bacterium]|nr:HAD family phosphatase [Bacteroidota bacterium]
MQDLLKGIKNIIFDFGGVILNLNMQQCITEFEKLGLKDIATMYSVISQFDFFSKLEKGLASNQDFYNEVRKFTDKIISDREIENAWNAMINDIPAERIKMLEKLNTGPKYRTFLLSNTNAIHYDFYVGNLTKEYGYKNFSALFEKDYFSHKLGMKKPDAEIFEFVLNDSGLIPAETLFIDDSPENTKGAEALGIKSFLLQADFDIVELFAE